MLTLQIQRFSVWSIDPTASVLLPGNLLQMCVLKPQPSPAYSKALGLYSSSLCFDKPCMGCTKSNSYCLRFLQLVLAFSNMASLSFCIHKTFPGCSEDKESTCNTADPDSVLGSGRSLGEGNGHPLQYSYWENSMDRRAWRATVHGVTKSQTQWSH